jgi:hypothetical protein
MEVHFPIAIWLDYVRGFGDAAMRSAIETHLARGCPDCAGQFERVSLVKAVSLAEVEVPSDVVDRALAIFPTVRHPGWREVLAALVFDSFATPQMAGVRAASNSIRRLRFLARPGHEVEMELETKAETTRIIGQVTGDAANSQIRVTAAGEVVASAQANAFGEFELNVTAGKDLSLEIVLTGGEVIRISLPADGQLLGGKL